MKPFYQSYNHKSDINTKKETMNDGKSLERELETMYTTGEPIESTRELIYQDRADGINPAFDIRTDRMQIARKATSAVNKQRIIKRKEWIKNHNSQEQEQEQN